MVEGKGEINLCWSYVGSTDCKILIFFAKQKHLCKRRVQFCNITWTVVVVTCHLSEVDWRVRCRYVISVFEFWHTMRSCKASKGHFIFKDLKPTSWTSNKWCSCCCWRWSYHCLPNRPSRKKLLQFGRSIGTCCIHYIHFASSSSKNSFWQILNFWIWDLIISSRFPL